MQPSQPLRHAASHTAPRLRIETGVRGRAFVIQHYVGGSTCFLVAWMMIMCCSYVGTPNAADQYASKVVFHIASWWDIVLATNYSRDAWESDLIPLEWRKEALSALVLCPMSF